MSTPETLPPTSEPSPARLDLDRSLVGGVAWTTGTKWASQAVTWVTTIIVARILMPEDYGLIGMAQLVVALALLFAELGFTEAVARFRDLTRNQLDQLNTVSMGMGVVLFGLAALAARPVSIFFDAPRLPVVLLAMSTTFIFSAFKVVPYALLVRDLRFRFLAIVDGAQAVATAIFTLLLAWAGYGYWALAWGLVLGSALNALPLALVVRQGFARPRLEDVREVIGFSSDILVNRFAWYLWFNADFIVVGRVLGQTALGFYTFAWTLASVPVEKLTSLILRVTPGIFSAVQSDRPGLRRYLLGLTEAILLITVPAGVGLSLVANDFTLVILGEKWGGMVPALQLLALAIPLRSVTPLLNQVLNIMGDSRYAMWNSVLRAVVLPLGFVAGAHWDTAGVAAVWVFVYPVVTLPLLLRVDQRIGLSATDYARAAWPSVSSGGAMIGGVLLIGLGFSALLPSWALLGAQVVAGATTYLLTYRYAHPRRWAAARATVAQLRTR